ncbi:hypothetical protein F5141DRAFT_1129402 [Pisolithus sp. B1]|nr:hypothetical protein F5141DRAFT_1129402 [Pisolithus sp. B1]
MHVLVRLWDSRKTSAHMSQRILWPTHLLACATFSMAGRCHLRRLPDVVALWFQLVILSHRLIRVHQRWSAPCHPSPAQLGPRPSTSWILVDFPKSSGCTGMSENDRTKLYSRGKMSTINLCCREHSGCEDCTLACDFALVLSQDVSVL